MLFVHSKTSKGFSIFKKLDSHPAMSQRLTILWRAERERYRERERQRERGVPQGYSLIIVM